MEILNYLPMILIIALIVWGIAQYNGLVILKNQIKNAWAQIDVQLKRRHDLIPNLVETVKGYAAHEANALENVIKARQTAINVSDNIKAKSVAENALSGALKSLFAVSENYPDLKANQNFLQLQEEITSTENKISAARQFYNDAVLNYNNEKETFPSNIIANIFHFEQKEFFEINSEEKNAPQVKF